MGFNIGGFAQGLGQGYTKGREMRKGALEEEQLQAQRDAYDESMVEEAIPTESTELSDQLEAQTEGLFEDEGLQKAVPDNIEKMEYDENQLAQKSKKRTTRLDLVKYRDTIEQKLIALGHVDAAQKARALASESIREKSNELFGTAMAQIQAGDTAGAMRSLTAAGEFLPTGSQLDFRMTDDGHIMVKSIDEETGDMEERRLTAADVAKIATGLGNPQKFFEMQMLSEANWRANRQDKRAEAGETRAAAMHEKDLTIKGAQARWAERLGELTYEKAQLDLDKALWESNARAIHGDREYRLKLDEIEAKIAYYNGLAAEKQAKAKAEGSGGWDPKAQNNYSQRVKDESELAAKGIELKLSLLAGQVDAEGNPKQADLALLERAFTTKGVEIRADAMAIGTASRGQIPPAVAHEAASRWAVAVTAVEQGQADTAVEALLGLPKGHDVDKAKIYEQFGKNFLKNKDGQLWVVIGDKWVPASSSMGSRILRDLAALKPAGAESAIPPSTETPTFNPGPSDVPSFGSVPTGVPSPSSTPHPQTTKLRP